MPPDNPTPDNPAAIIQAATSLAVPEPPKAHAPGEPGYDPRLDPRIKQWGDSLLQEAGRKEQEISALKTQLQQINEQLTPLKAQVAEFLKKEKDRSDADLTEIQRHQARLTEAEQRERDFTAKLEAAQAESTRIAETYSREREAWRNERELIGLLGLHGIYPNEFEQEGLFSRARSITYKSEEERQSGLNALVTSFARHHPPNGHQPAVIPPAGITPTTPPVVTPFTPPTPPGGTPPRTPQILDDNYTDYELTQLARTNRELYEKIAVQRAAMRQARGALPVGVR